MIRISPQLENLKALSLSFWAKISQYHLCMAHNTSKMDAKGGCMNFCELLTQKRKQPVMIHISSQLENLKALSLPCGAKVRRAETFFLAQE